MPLEASGQKLYTACMSWASRRKTAYVAGISLSLFVVIGGPLSYLYFSVPPTCNDGIQNQNETAVDRGGRCSVFDERALQPHTTLWSRSFRVRDGSYNAVAYVYNPNAEAGVRRAYYRFGLYDAANILVAEREGITFIVPGAVTPILESRIDAGNRIVARTYFEFTNDFVWERMINTGLALAVNNKEISNVTVTPRLSANAENRSLADIVSPSFVAVIFDPAGNAFAASATTLERLSADEIAPLVFSWPDPFLVPVGRVDVLPLVAPSPAPGLDE